MHMQLMKEFILAAILAALVLTAGSVALNTHLDRRALAHEVAALERRVAQQAEALRQMDILAAQLQHRALEVESLYTASELLELFAADLAAAGHPVSVSYCVGM